MGCRAWCKKEFGFYDSSTNDFGAAVFGKTIHMAVVKLILLVYWTAMWMYRLINFYIIKPAEKREEDPTYVRHREYSDYLTNWGDTLVFLYLFYSTLVVFHILYAERKQGTPAGGNKAIWFHYITQVLFEIALPIAILITINFFLFLGDLWDPTQAGNVHAHVMNATIMLLEFTFNRIPIRFFHFLYPACVMLLYMLGNYLGYLSNPERNGTYEAFIDWTDNDAGFFVGTIETLLLLGPVAVTVIHLLIWGVYQLKVALCKRCTNNSVHDQTGTNL